MRSERTGLLLAPVAEVDDRGPELIDFGRVVGIGLARRIGVELAVGQAVDGRALADATGVDGHDVVLVEDVAAEPRLHDVGEAVRLASGTTRVDEQAATTISLRRDDLDLELQRLAVRFLVVDRHFHLRAAGLAAVVPRELLGVELPEAARHAFGCRRRLTGFRFVVATCARDDGECDRGDQHGGEKRGKDLGASGHGRNPITHPSVRRRRP
jgi:hypothetical protein